MNSAEGPRGSTVFIGTTLRGLVIIVAVLLLTGGCFQITSSTAKGAVHLKSAESFQKNETRQGSFRGSATVKGSVVRIEAIQLTDCRTIQVTPAEQDVQTVNKLASTQGVLWSSIGGGALVALGIVGVVSTCPPVTGTDKQGNQLNNECLPGDEARQVGYNVAGGVSIGVGALLGALAIGNGVRALDETTRVPHAATEKPGPWAVCRKQIAANQPVLLVFSNGTHLSGRTSAKGVAVIKLSAVDALAVVENPTARVMLKGHKIAKVDLTESSLFPQWWEAYELAMAERQADERANDQQRLAKKRAEEEEQAQLEAERATAERAIAKKLAKWPVIAEDELVKNIQVIQKVAVLSGNQSKAPALLFTASVVCGKNLLSMMVAGVDADQRRRNCRKLIVGAFPNDVANVPPGSSTWRVSPYLKEAFAVARRALPGLRREAIKRQRKACYNKCIKIIGARPENCNARCAE